MDMKKIRNFVRKAYIERRNIRLLKCVKISKRFEEKVIKLVDVGVPNLWGHCKDAFLDHVMRCVGRRVGGEVKQMHGGEMLR